MKTENYQKPQLSPAQIKRLMFDYDKAQEMIRHYEQLFWQVGAILLAGLFVMMGIISDNKYFVKEPYRLLPVIAITLLIDLFWFLWYQRNRILVLGRFQRLRDIENLVPELRNYSYSLEEESIRLDTPRSKNFRMWLTCHIRHSFLLKCFCILLPIPIIAVFICAYLSSKTFDWTLIILLVFFTLPLLVIVLYPKEPYPKKENKKIDLSCIGNFLL